MEDVLRKVQLTQLEILKELDRICKKEGLQYFLAYGCLIGAARHKGFIPWDDDLDILMPRSDYDRLMQVLPGELKTEYWLQNYETDAQYWLAYAKVRKKGTLFKEKALKNISDEKCGIWVDVFPLDCTRKPGSLGIKLRRWVVETLGFAIRRKMLGQSLRNNSRRYVPASLMWCLLPAKWLKKLQVWCMRGIGSERDGCYVNISGTYQVAKEVYPVAWFLPAKSLPFEDTVCPVPGEYQRVLEQLYGDYMTPPPPEKRGGHNMDEKAIIV